MPLVTGLDAFKLAMAGHENGYVLIGGSACSILFREVGLDFRQTQDLDIVVLAESNDAEFARALWDFIRGAGYECGMREDGKARYYRFNLPNDSPNLMTCPKCIELFTRHPDFELKAPDSAIAPLPFDEASSSLSAIVLDDEYYGFIRDNVANVEGVPLLRAMHIIPLKMRAHIDLNRRHNEGQHVDGKDLRKHRSDVSKLTDLLSQTSRCKLQGQLRRDAETFLQDFAAFAAASQNRQEKARLEESLAVLKAVYL